MNYNPTRPEATIASPFFIVMGNEYHGPHGGTHHHNIHEFKQEALSFLRRKENLTAPIIGVCTVTDSQAAHLHFPGGKLHKVEKPRFACIGFIDSQTANRRKAAGFLNDFASFLAAAMGQPVAHISYGGKNWTVEYDPSHVTSLRGD